MITGLVCIIPAETGLAAINFSSCNGCINPDLNRLLLRMCLF
ncbi:hypothetical protein KPSA1_02504 [Pseudomonas syringae pv. actinidiae]|uniref:Uncharacterized protein n=1 Tax=Pseudomonas syringae pv. actinidiae TaxID=103796 RepID=A0A2V0QKL8_PSESF|nr:hypothetical protein KPSA1_02504 [Pseudomonas syringae pv. actinidiae]